LQREPENNCASARFGLAFLMLSILVGGGTILVTSKTNKIFRFFTALLVLSGMLTLQACFFDDGGHWHHWHHHDHYDDRR
jgi:disulfide bond formation protein DsbB